MQMTIKVGFTPEGILMQIDLLDSVMNFYEIIQKKNPVNISMK